MEKKQTFISRLDENVIITMLVVSVLASIILAFRVKNYEPCVPFTVRTTPGMHYSGEVIQFETNAGASKNLKWNFGDNRNDEAGNASAAHTYAQPGNYEVTISADNRCTQNLTVTISQAPLIVDPSKMPTFISPEFAEVGKPVTFKDTTKGATRWEWRFGETATADAVSSNPVYVYKESGYKTVSLIVNDDQDHIASHKIFVNPAPAKALPKNNSGGGGRPTIVISDRPQNDPLETQVHPPVEPPPAIVTGMDITKPEIEAKLRQVADKLLTTESFSAYMCGNLNIPVSLNGTEVTFTAFCNQLSALKSSKKIKRLDVQMFKDEKTHCIKGLNVNFKKKEGFLGIGN